MKKNRNQILAVLLALACSWPTACGNRADRTYRQGLRLARQKKYDQAVGEMRRLLQMEPESSRARAALGQIYRAQNLYSRAIEEMALAVETGGEDPVPAYNLAGLYWDLEDLKQASRYYRQAIELDPGFAPALYRMGVVTLRRGDPRTAEYYFRAYLKTEPEDPAPGYNNLGVLLWRQGDREEAFQEFEKALSADSRHPEILYNFGVSSLLLRQETRRGVDTLLEYFRARPDGRERVELKRLLEKSGLVSATEAGIFTRDDYLRQGEEYEAAGQYRPAAVEYRRALELDPNSGEAHYRLARLSDRFLNDPESAVAHYETFLKLRPGSSRAGEAISRLSALRPSLAPAPPAADAAVLTPSPVPAPSTPEPAPAALGAEEYRLQGDRLAREGDFKRAAEVYRLCLKADPGNLPAQIGLGTALLAAGDYPGAEEALVRARDLDPAAPVGQFLGRTYILLGAGSLTSGNFERSIDYYLKAREEGMTAEAEEGLWKAHHNFARRLRERGEYPEAARQLERCLELRPEVEEDYIELARIYGEEMGRPDRARFYYRRYQELFPRGGQSKLAAEKLRPVPTPPPVAPRPTPFRRPGPAREISAVEHYNRGTVYQREGRYARAREEYLQAIRRRPEFYQAFYNLGVTFQQEDRPDQALAAFKQAARLNPDFPQAQLSLFNLYYYHYRMKNLARPHGLRYLELAPGSPSARELRQRLGIQ